MHLGERLRRYVLSLPDEAADNLPLLDEAKLAELGKWFGAAITLLAGVFGFLGMQGGALDRMLRLYPSEAMLTFFVVVAALLCSILGPAVRDGYRLRLHVFALGILGFLWLVAWSLPNLHSARTLAFPLHYAYGVYAALFVFAALTWRFRISLRGATFVAGVVLLTAGICAGVKLSVLSKLGERPAPSVSVSVQPRDHQYIVQLRVRASALTDNQWVALEVAYDENVSTLRLDPNALGELDSQAEVPVPQTAGQVIISSQLCDTTCDNQPVVENAALTLPEPTTSTTETTINAATSPNTEPTRDLDPPRHPRTTPSKRRTD
jgi:hypothetical protein